MARYAHINAVEDFMFYFNSKRFPDSAHVPSGAFIEFKVSEDRKKIHIKFKWEHKGRRKMHKTFLRLNSGEYRYEEESLYSLTPIVKPKTKLKRKQVKKRRKND